MQNTSITVSAPCKVHLLGEHSVVYGKPALLTTVDLRITATVIARNKGGPSKRDKQSRLVKNPNQIASLIARNDEIKKVIEPIVKKHLKLKKLPSYQIEIKSEAPIGAGLGSSAAISATYITAFLSFLKVKWDLNLINELTYEAEKVFHGNPSGADNSTIVYGGLVWYRKESPDLKIIHPLPFSIPYKLSKNFVLINTGTPKLTTKKMITQITADFEKNPTLKDQFLNSQEKLTRELLTAIKKANEKEIIRIIREGERNLELIGVCSKEVASIIRNIEKSGGAAKICGAGADSGPTGVLLCYHKNPQILEEIAKSNNLVYFKVKLGVKGLRKE